MGLRREYKPSVWIKRVLLVLLLIVVVWATSCSFGSSSEGKQSWRPKQEIATMERFFEVALAPVGSTMYVWGGGWDSGDDRAGASATQIGMSQTWADFAAEQTEAYNFEEYMDEQDKGLDCSGYVGWVMYNLFEDEDGKTGYVTLSTEMAEKFASRGWGNLIKNPHEFLPGDIVSMQGHVWICLGTCEDGSVLLIHSSPPGVSVCGTVVPSGLDEAGDNKGTTSVAVSLAEAFMSSKYPKWQETYSNRTVPSTYLEDVTLMRWNENALGDVSEYQNMSGEEIMEILSGI